MQLSGFLGAGSATSMTSFFSWSFFMVFIPLCVISYTLVPNKLKKYHLLLASYVFYWLVSGELIIYLLLSTVSIAIFGSRSMQWLSGKYAREWINSRMFS